VGGGKKRRSISQMVKSQSAEKGRGKSKSGKRGESSSGREKRGLKIVQPNPGDKGATSELLKMRVLTPYTVASRLNLRLGVAKDLLEDLHRRGLITYVSGGRNIRIYKPAEKD